MTDASATADRALSPPLSLVLIRGALRLLSRTSPNAAARVATNLFMKPRRYARPERERAALARATAFEVVHGKSAIKAWSWGGLDRPVVYLVHGWEGRGSQLAALAQPLVEAGFRVVTFDAPGHGETGGARSSLPEFAWALRRVADAAGEPYALIAHSLGCAAATLALKESLPARRSVFFAPPFDPATYTARFGDILALDAGVVEGMKARIEDRFLRKWSDYSLGETAKRMSTPLLIIHDRDDRETFWSEGAALAEAWPSSRLVTTSGLGHRRILWEPSLVAETVRFIASDGLEVQS